jgi:hypothetical protein
MKKGIVTIKITIKTPTATVTQCFDRADFETNEAWAEAAKKWIRED